MSLDKGEYAFWDLVAEEAYKPQDKSLLAGSFDTLSSNVQNKRVWLFPCNPVTQLVIEKYKNEWNIAGVFDNASSKWGQALSGIKIFSPNEIVPTLDEEKDVIILALRLNADAVVKQLKALGFNNIFSWGVVLKNIEPYGSFISEVEELLTNSEVEDIIMMESMNDFDGNVGALYEYLKKSNSTHKFIWICKSNESISLRIEENDICLFPRNSIEDLKKYIKLRAQAKWEIWECDSIRKVRPEQINIFLQHYGMGYKQVAHLYSSPWYVDYVLTTNEFVRKMEEKSITYSPTSKFVYGELPRNDVLKKSEWNELAKITKENFNKVVMWAPTLRESRYFNREDSDISHPFGVSLIYEKNQMDEVNDYLKNHNMLLVIKIHPRQKINFNETDYSNITYIDGVKSKEIHGYKLMTQMDALITDYSSIVFDYMLLDRPVAWVLEDRAHYKIEYLMDNPDEYMPGEKIYELKDLFHFFDNVANGTDLYKTERREICARCNQPFEGKGSERLQEVFNL